MVRHDAAYLWLFALMIGAAGMRPRMPMKSNSVYVRLPPLAPPSSFADQPPSSAAPSDPDQTGVASWYGDHWQGRVMASGKPFDARKLTAAHRTLPLNTRVRVTNLLTGRSVEVTITDRGPYIHGRVIDLSTAAAKQLGMVKQGLVPVRIASIS